MTRLGTVAAPPIVTERGATTPKGRWKGRLNQGLLTLFAIIFAFPLIWMVVSSLKSGSEVFSSPPKVVGSTVMWSNYADVWSYQPFGLYMFNGFLVATLGTVLVVVTSLGSGYAFSRLRFRGRDKLFFVFLATLMVPSEIVVIPMYLFMMQLGWINTVQALVVPWAFSAFGTFFLRQALLTVPLELEEAGKLDGASHFYIMVRIMAPLIKPSLAVLIVFTFVNYWNSFLWPLIVLNGPAHATVPLGLNFFIGEGGSQWQLIMAASTISMIPTALLAILLQRYLVRGISMSAGLGGR